VKPHEPGQAGGMFFRSVPTMRKRFLFSSTLKGCPGRPMGGPPRRLAGSGQSPGPDASPAHPQLIGRPFATSWANLPESTDYGGEAHWCKIPVEPSPRVEDFPPPIPHLLRQRPVDPPAANRPRIRRCPCWSRLIFPLPPGFHSRKPVPQ